jgi:hypothetical protein
MASTSKLRIRSYPHFDRMISIDQAEAYVNDATKVATHTFYPLILHQKKWNKWAKAGQSGKPKSRPIRYCARLDACIFSHYRDILSEHYESYLRDDGLADSVIAYRKIKKSDGAGKCNIDFAKDAFDFIESLDHSYSIALDISSFFERIPHKVILEKWKSLLGCKKLPDDHFAVFSAATSYSFVDRETLYRKLGYIVPVVLPSGRLSYEYSVKWNDIPKQLCTPVDFRSKVAGGDGAGSMIKKNHKNYGVAQGLPISDLIANMSLADFDEQMMQWCSTKGGRYVRYSDDILLIIPTDSVHYQDAINECKIRLAKISKTLQIKDSKTLIVKYKRSADGCLECWEPDGLSWKPSRGLEYLGFRFSGRNVYLRDSTLSNLWRKVARSAVGVALNSRKRFVGKSKTEIRDLIDKEEFLQRFSKVKDFEEKASCPEEWTFWTYAKRSADIFGSSGGPIIRQMRNFRRKALAKLESAVMR